MGEFYGSAKEDGSEELHDSAISLSMDAQRHPWGLRLCPSVAKRCLDRSFPLMPK